MNIRFRCTKCRTPLETEAQASGSKAPCPRCGALIVVPQAFIGPGSTLAGFRIERLIGEGGMGQVYLARQLSMDRDVALKIMRHEGDLSHEDAQRFLHEVRMLARLDHPNIVTAHEAGEDHGVLFLAMTFVRGEPLDRRIGREGAIPEREVLRIARKVARALEYAWNEHRLLHRDIKPSNILLDTHGEPKLADLGLAQSLAREGRGSDDLVGTPNYMSPEQIAGRSDMDFRTDLYALGATMYHMLTGHLPFAANTPEETLRLKRSTPLADPRTIQASVSAGCVTVLGRMLAQEPADRYRSWEEFLADIERVLDGQDPAREGPAAAPHRMKISAAELHQLRQKTPGRQRPAWVFPVTVLVIVVAFVATAVVGVRMAMPRIRPTLPDHFPRPGDPPPVSALPPGLGPTEMEKKFQEEARKLREREAQLRTRFNALLESGTRENLPPGEWVRRLEAFRPEAGETGLLPEIDAQIQRYREADRAGRASVLQNLRRQAQQRADQKDFEGAAQLLEKYKSAYAAETLDERRADAEQWRTKGQSWQKEQQQLREQSWPRIRPALADAILQRDLPGARKRLDAAIRESGVKPDEPEAAAWGRLIDALTRFDAVILESYQPDEGKSVEFSLTRGTEVWQVGRVTPEGIEVRRLSGTAVASRIVSITELTPTEKYRRLERTPPPLREQLRGWLAMQNQLITAALKNFRAGSDPVSQALAERTDVLAQEIAKTATDTALRAMIQRAGVTGPAEDYPAMAAQIRRIAYPPKDALSLRTMAGDFRRQYGDTDTGRKAEALLRAAENAAGYPRDVDPAVIDQALDRLVAQNPGSRKKECVWTCEDTGLALSITSRFVKVVTALEGLPIVKLSLAKTPVRDITPLRNLPLMKLDLSGTRVQDLFALKFAPLKEMVLAGCGLSSLSPLRGFALEAVDVSDNPINTLSALQGMALKRLSARNCNISTLTSLARMPLEALDLQGCTEVRELKPLRGMPIRNLNLSRTGIDDLSALAGMPLEKLALDRCERLRDLRTVPDDLPVRELRIENCQTGDLAPLCKLRSMECLVLAHSDAVEHLRGLEGLALKDLDVSRTGIQRLDFAQRFPSLERLTVKGCSFPDLNPLKGTTLRYLNLEGCEQIESLAPLTDCGKLEVVILPKHKDPSCLRDHPSLTHINWSPVKQFWENRDKANKNTPKP